MSVIIVDDSALKIKMIQKYMSKYFSSIEVAETGAEALDMLESNNYEYVFLDHHLPDCKGSELIERIKNANESSKIIATSSDYFIQKSFKEIGYDEAFVFPFDKSVERIVLENRE